MNPELRRLFEEDQGDRLGETFPEDMPERDRLRRDRVAELLDSGGSLDGEDLFHAAMVFQHGSHLGDWWRAHELALQAIALDHRPAKWLAAAALDRWLVNQGRPQKYGTQYRAVGGRWELGDVDPTTTDEERAEWDVPSLREAVRQAESMALLMPPVGGEVLGSALADRLRLDIIRVDASFRNRLPPWKPSPLQTGDPVPTLPDGLVAFRFGSVWAASTDGDGVPVVFWSRSPGAQIAVGWSVEDGDVPPVEVLEIDGWSGLYVDGTAAGRERMLLIGRPESPWTVGGTLAREELMTVAASLLQIPAENEAARSGAYNQSKLANLLFTYELARRPAGTRVTANASDPSFVKTSRASYDEDAAKRPWLVSAELTHLEASMPVTSSQPRP